jgi:two-component system OmpR family sensor kinase/two-component system sensor histidine kinase BaeS
LTRLTKAARAFGEHDWNHRVPTNGVTELRALASAFNSMADELQRAETLRRNLIADIAHELRTPLSVMQANLLALLDGIYPLEKGEIATLYEETCALNRLVDDLRELARADAGQLSLNLATVNLTALLSKVTATFAIAAEAENVQIALTEADQALCVEADANRVTQIVGNLLSNALRHTSGGCVTISTENIPARTDSPAMIRVSVSDTGEGIPPKELPHVFDRFYRVDKSRARVTGNSGLGLAIAKAWVEAMGGSIGAESVYGQGSRFWFALPVSIENSQDR